MSAPDPEKQAEEARLWVAKADQDVAMVERLLVEPPLLEGAAFHCQQAAEKLLKAALVAAAHRVRKTHDLDALASEVVAVAPALRGVVDPLRRRTAWVATFRYPGADDATAQLPDREEVKAVVGQIAALRAAVVALTG